MGTPTTALTMAPFIILFLAAAVSCEAEADPYTIGQVATGQTAGGVITGVDYGHGLVSGVGALGTGRVAASVAVPAVTYSHGVVATHHTAPLTTYSLPYYPYAYGKREAEPYTVGQIAHGAHIANAAADPAAAYHVPYVYGKRSADADAFYGAYP